jgi:hypothetical protein
MVPPLSELVERVFSLSAAGYAGTNWWIIIIKLPN